MTSAYALLLSFAPLLHSVDSASSAFAFAADFFCAADSAFCALPAAFFVFSPAAFLPAMVSLRLISSRWVDGKWIVNRMQIRDRQKFVVVAGRSSRQTCAFTTCVAIRTFA